MSICSNQYIYHETNIRKIYLAYKHSRNKCILWQDYFELGKRAYIAGRLKEALWSTDQALRYLDKKDRVSEMQLKTLKGSVLRKMNRVEEAIIELREIIFFGSNSRSEKIQKERQKAHMQLIHAYYAKTGSKSSQDVTYLLSLFKSRYPQSPYLKLINNWEGAK